MYFFPRREADHSRLALLDFETSGQKQSSTHLGHSFMSATHRLVHMAVGQNFVPLVNIKIGGKWMFVHPKMEP